MRRERVKYKEQEFEVTTFEAEVTLGSGKELQQIDTLLKEEADTNSGKRKVKPIDKRRKPIEL